MSDADRSPGGSKILRHEPVDRGFTPAHPQASAEEVEEHIARHFGTPETVFHEIGSDLVHLDVQVVPPVRERDWWTLYTTGMSALPMTVPEGRDELRFAELVIKLPPTWRLDALKTIPPAPGAEKWYWPIAGLKMLARLPHDYKTWLGFGHTIPNGDPPRPFAPDTDMCSWLLLPPLGVPDDGRAFSLSDGSVVNLYIVHALYRDELELKLQEGTDALLDRFDQAGIDEVLDPKRPSVVRKHRFGFRQ